MKFFKRFLAVLISLVILVVAFVFAYLFYLLPKHHGQAKIDGVKNDVQVYFDEYAIPHIYAQTNEDAWAALGYLHAQDRLFQMELLRRVGGGRLSEIFGKDLLKVDKLFRALRIAEVAKKSVKDYFTENNQPYQKLTLAYLKGINNYITEGKTPVEFTMLGIKKEKFTVEDIYLISGYMAFSFAEAFRTDPILTSIKNNLGGNYLKDILITQIDSAIKTNSCLNDSALTSQSKIAIQLSDILTKNPVPSFIGSNAWVVAPAKSASGKVLFCNDTHIGYAAPCVWYEAHIQTKTDTIYGNFLAGFPFPLIGHTRHHAWGLTMFENDDINLYSEKLNPENPDQYFYNNSWLPLKTRTELINIKNEAPISYTLKSTHHGSIINQVVEEVDSSYSSPISVHWIYNHFPATTVQASYQMAFAKNISEMQYGASLINAPGLNILYGDVDGNIAWWAAAKLLAFDKNLNTKLILDGTLPDNEPVDTLSFEENPHSINPACNYIFSSNYYPNNNFNPVIPGYYAPSDRAIEINNYLNKKNKFSIKDMKQLQTSFVSSSKKEIALILANIISKESSRLNQFQKNCLSYLQNWDGNHNTNDVAPTVFYSVFSLVMKNSLQDELGSKYYNKLVNTHTIKESQLKLISNSGSLWWDNVHTTEKENRSRILFNSFIEATDLLKNKYGGNFENLTWKNYHTLEHPHALGTQKPLDKIFNINKKGVGGGNETVNNAGFDLDTSATFKTKYGPAMRIVLDLANVDSGYSCLPTGQSGYFFSNHYSDQADLFIHNRYRSMFMNSNFINEKNKNVLVIKPKIN